MFKKIIKEAALPLFVSIGTVLGSVAFADQVCTENGKIVDCAGFGWILWAGLGGSVIIVAIVILATMFWLRMILHASKHDIPNKSFWIMLMVFTHLLGALIYYFTVKRNFKSAPLA